MTGTPRGGDKGRTGDTGAHSVRHPAGYDVIVVGGGNAALCAAISACEQGANVLVLERAPREERGGNSRFTAGAIRFAFADAAEVQELAGDLTEAERRLYDFGSYAEDDFFNDMARVTNFRADPELTDVLVSNSLDTMRWYRRHGIRFTPNGRQAFRVDDRMRFWGGLVLDAWGGGPGLVDGLYAEAERLGADIWYGARGLDLVRDDDGVHGLRLRHAGRSETVAARTVVLASGGFEANSEMRAMYMGPGWDTVRVRGTRYNMGDGIRMALAAGAMPWGQWSGAHAVPWDRNAPAFGDLAVGDGFSKLSYPFGIMVNRDGERFLDEGADFRNYTYARYGREILIQPEGLAWQVFDAKVGSLLRDEYRIRQATRATADSLEELARKMNALAGLHVDRFLETVHAFNGAVDTAVPFNPAAKDGRGTKNLAPAKSNWANPLDTPPFEAFAVSCGITFTFGGLRISPATAQVLDTEDEPLPGLFAAGELVGGLFYGNYPGGSGLMSGAVFGRLAGHSAAIAAR